MSSEAGAFHFQGNEILSLATDNKGIKPKGFDLTKWLSDRDIFNCLVSKGFRIMDDLDEEEWVDVLRKIFKKKDLNFVQELIANGLTCGNINPVTIAIKCMSYNDTDDTTSVVRYLVENGVSIQAPEKYNKINEDVLPENSTSPLMEAICSRQDNLVEYLIKQGAKVRIQEGEFDRYVKILKKANIDFNAAGAIVLRAALGRDYYVDNAKLRLKKIETLIEAGASPNTISEDGSTCGHHYVKELQEGRSPYYNNYQEGVMVKAILDVFLKHGLNMNAVNKNGATMLHLFDWKNLELLESLLSRGADPNISANTGGTVATMKMLQLIKEGEMQKFCDVLDLLMKYNADLTAEDIKHTTIFSALLDARDDYEVYKAVQHLLNVAEVGLLSGAQIDALIPAHDFSTTIPMLQAGCNYKCLLDRLSTIAISYQHYVADGFNFQNFAACLDPFYDYKKKLELALRFRDSLHMSTVENINEAAEESSNASIPHPHPLKCYAVHSIRKQILKANRNRSLIPRAKKLPLPKGMIEMVTLECYKMNDLEAEREKFKQYLSMHTTSNSQSHSLQQLLGSEGFYE